MTDHIDLGIIKFNLHISTDECDRLTASVDALEVYVSLTLGRDGLWIIDIDGEFVADEYPSAESAAMAALGHLIVHAVDVVVQAPGIDNADLQRRAKLCRDWLNDVTDRMHGTLPASIQHALNSGDGSYRP